jgi:Protein of unknown function (DUF3040)
MRALTQARTRTRTGRPRAVRSHRQQIAGQEHIMSLNYHQQHQLSRIESRLLRSDPKLASMLTVFARLSAGQRMPTWEQIATRPDRIRQAAALIAKAIAIMAVAIGLLVSAIHALLTAIVMGSRARPSRPARQRTRPGTDGRPNPASSG